jgi:hypothetical protein
MVLTIDAGVPWFEYSRNETEQSMTLPSGKL